MAIAATTQRIPPELEAEMSPAVRAFILSLFDKIDALSTKVDSLTAHCATLERENCDLKGEVARLKKTPINSSLPPSSQHPHAKPPRDSKNKKKRKRGGQKGHPKHERALVPTDQCDEVVPLKPENCRRCGEELSGADGQPLRYQVWELPEIKPIIIEYQRHRLRCAGCGETTCASLPPEVQGQSGPRLVAFVALLMASFRQSKRRAAHFLTTVLNTPCSAAWTVNLQNQATLAARPAYEELAAALPDQSHLGGDETPMKQGNQKTWLWTFVAATFTVFAARGSRAATNIRELLGEAFAGVMTCDRAKMYWSVGNIQWCWAHLKRDFQSLIDHPDFKAKRLGRDLMRPTRDMFKYWARYRDGTLSWEMFKTKMTPIRREIESLLLRGVFTESKRTRGMCKELYKHREWLWTFLDHEGLGLTNNASERALRHAVIWRKLSFGTQSEGGSRFVETMLSVIETCRQQNRDVFDFLATAIRAHRAGQPHPSLLANP